jgi:hypothetical protein
MMGRIENSSLLRILSFEKRLTGSSNKKKKTKGLSTALQTYVGLYPVHGGMLSVRICE